MVLTRRNAKESDQSMSSIELRKITATMQQNNYASSVSRLMITCSTVVLQCYRW